MDYDPDSQMVADANAAIDLRAENDRLRRDFADLQEHSYIGHIVKCSKCGANLTSLLLCPDCGIRYELVPMEAK